MVLIFANPTLSLHTVPLDRLDVFSGWSSVHSRRLHSIVSFLELLRRALIWSDAVMDACALCGSTARPFGYGEGNLGAVASWHLINWRFTLCHCALSCN
jgi:hypothetical protein